MLHLEHLDEPCEDVKDAGDCTALLDAFVYIETSSAALRASGNSMTYNRSSSWYYGDENFVLR